MLETKEISVDILEYNWVVGNFLLSPQDDKVEKKLKLGVICDGISRDLKHSLGVMNEFDLEYAELQYVDDKEVGDHSKAEIDKINRLLGDNGKPVSCLSRHIFAGMTIANVPGDDLHTRHMDVPVRLLIARL